MTKILVRYGQQSWSMFDFNYVVTETPPIVTPPAGFMGPKPCLFTPTKTDLVNTISVGHAVVGLIDSHK
jgi:hypothetical protein